MIRFAILLFIPLILLSCDHNPNFEEKASLILNYEIPKLSSSLHLIRSEPIDTRIDSAFTSIYDDIDVIKSVYDYINQQSTIEHKKQALLQTIKEKAEKVIEHKFYGWKIFHRFRSEDVFGKIQINEIVLTTNEDLTNVTHRYLVNSEDKYSFDNIKRIVDYAINQ